MRFAVSVTMEIEDLYCGFLQYGTVSGRWLSTFWSNILPHYSY